MMAHELRGAIGEMDRKDGRGKSGFENQFQVLVFNMIPSGVAIESKSCNNIACCSYLLNCCIMYNCFSITFHSASTASFGLCL